MSTLSIEEQQRRNRERCKRYYWKHREQERKRKHKNVDRNRIGQGRWREANREHFNARAREWRKNHPEYAATHARDYWLRNKFGVTLKWYYEQFDKQGGVCAICGEPETHKRNNKTRILCVDHDHKTGKIRALLCSRCNVTIGRLNDDPALLQKMIDYLVKHQKATNPEPPLQPSLL